jgi:Xaa-Pro dipeptidase
MGRETFTVPFEDVFVANRRKFVDQLRKTADAADVVVFLEGGISTTRFDSDHEPLFPQESYFWYLSGIKDPDCAIALDSRCGEWRNDNFHSSLAGRLHHCDWAD